MYHQPVRARDTESVDLLDDFNRDGFVIVRGLFSKPEIARLAQAAEQIFDEGVAHGRSFRHGNLFYDVADGAQGDPFVRMVQWPSYHQPVLNEVRLDRRIAQLLEPLIGRDLKQIINQIHWKGQSGVSDFAWHQDCRFRRPAEAYRNIGRSYVQTGIAIDPHMPESGCMRVVPGSHRYGALPLDMSKAVIANPLSDDVLAAVGLSPSDVVDMLLDPGDLALWSPFLVHGSGSNRSAHKRRLYINGYVRADDCDRGEWAFRDGEPVPLGEAPALVHYDQLHERAGPHYV